MKKVMLLFIAGTIACTTLFSLSSCNRGTGCPMNENAHIQPNKKGKYPKSRTRSGLFPKGVYKRS